jgi:Zinc knuckle
MYVVTPPEPQQKPDQTIPEYITQWNSFIKLRLLIGCAYNDRYFIDRILAGMQPALHIHFEPALSHLCMSSLNHALPSQLHPMSIVGTLTQRAKELGHPEYMALTTHTLQDAPMHELDMHAVFGQRQCYICQSTMHTMRECPTRKCLEEPAIRRQLGLPALPATINQL